MKRWLSIKEAAEYMTLSRSTFVKNYADVIPYSHLGKRKVYDRQDLDTFLEGRKQNCVQYRVRPFAVSGRDILRSLGENYDPEDVVFDARLHRSGRPNLQMNVERHEN